MRLWGKKGHLMRWRRECPPNPQQLCLFTKHLEIERAACPQIDMQLVRDFVPCAPLSIEEIITLGAPAPAPPAAGRQHEQRRRWRVRQHSGCIGLSDQARQATQRRLKPPEWQQAQSQQEASRSTPKSDRPLNSARFLNLAVAALVLTPTLAPTPAVPPPVSPRRRRLAPDLQDPWMPTSTSRASRRHAWPAGPRLDACQPAAQRRCINILLFSRLLIFFADQAMREAWNCDCRLGPALTPAPRTAR